MCGRRQQAGNHGGRREQSGGQEGGPGTGQESARRFFLDPGTRALYPHWPDDAESMVAELRVQVGRRPEDPKLTALIGELSIRSDEFREHWARHPVRDKTHGAKAINHPVVGRLELSYERMILADDRDSTLYAYTAEPGSPTAERLALLASWSASDTPADAPAEERQKPGPSQR